MIKTDKFSSFAGEARSLSPLALAFVGDGVFELLVRGNLLNKHTIPAKQLHNMSVEQVNATSQAKAYDIIIDSLNDEEKDILRRGRNANPNRLPKNTTSEDYHKATALEVLFGFLFLDGQIDRLREIFDLMITNEFYKSGVIDEKSC